MVPITDEEKASPLYKYFTRPMVDAPAEKYAKAEQPMDPADALSPFEMNKLFDPGYLPGEIGYCNLPDGGGTLANLTPCPASRPRCLTSGLPGTAASRCAIRSGTPTSTTTA